MDGRFDGKVDSRKYRCKRDCLWKKVRNRSSIVEYLSHDSVAFEAFCCGQFIIRYNTLWWKLVRRSFDETMIHPRITRDLGRKTNCNLVIIIAAEITAKSGEVNEVRLRGRWTLNFIVTKLRHPVD